MSSLSQLSQMVPMLTPENWLLWRAQLDSFFMASGIFWTFEACPIRYTQKEDQEELEKEWKNDNQKGLGLIRLCLPPSILARVDTLKTVEEVIKTLKDEYGKL